MQPLASALAALLSLAALQASPTQPTPPAKPDSKPVETKPAETRPAATSQPNFIFIQAEATGWSSISVDMDGVPPSHARPKGLTPNLETMAAEGMRFSDFYASCPRCTPSRASFVTGISPAKLHMTYQNEGGNSRREQGDGGGYTLMKMVPPEVEEYIPKGVKTTADWLKELGYTSAHFGKWHAGRADPKANGFDASDGPNSNQGPERGVAPNPKQATVITDKGIAFMREAVKAGKPFYVQMSHYGFGSEEEATPESLALAKSLVSGVSGKPMGAIAGQYLVDQQIGRVRAALKEMGIDDNTYIFYSADHGAQGGGGGGGGRGGRSQANPPFSGAKGSVSEGGIRVPFIVVGPGVPAGVVSGVRATGMDLVPTMRDLAGMPIEKAADPDAQTAVEGGSLAPVLKSSGENAGKGTVARTREEIVIHFPHDDLNNGGPASAIYLGDHKLVRNYDAGTVKLYDIAKDRAESNDLAASMPERVKELEAKLDAYLKAIKAPMATPAADAPKQPAGGEAPADRPRRGGGQRGRNQPRESDRGLLERMTAFKTDVPATDHEVILAQPTATGITASVRASTDRLGAIEFARAGSDTRETTAKVALKAGVPTSIALTGLSPNTAYVYRFVWSPKEGEQPVRGDERCFHAPRAAGAPFAFVIQADSHLDQGLTPSVYEQTLANMAAAKPDFFVDLGDTFMTDKRGQDYERSLAQYDAQRYYFGLACHSMPLFMVLGNHDGEKGSAGRGIGEWSYNERVKRFPAPVIDGTTYTGATAMKDARGANYYAFEWGDALIVVLDPFWSTTERSRGGGDGGPNVEKLAPVDSSWSSTLGRAQYDWLAETLEKSKAKQKFVFIHHLVGGIGGSASRGGVESAPFFEWGGKNADGSDGFASRRAGWPMPIHRLLVKHGVSAVFHGHDHLYVHSTLDGIHYQCVPQPGNLAGNTRSAEEYGYASGTLHGSPGHVRVSMAADGTAKVEFVRTATADADAGGGGRARRGGGGQPAKAEPNGSVIDSYEIKP
jgi:arylsulfatase A-like enzyme/predicted phosphodiesterase